eukprot:NODE_39_length_35218_cov_0.479655.p2 type:complete len:538 gc:universal NODE_39_length_35218_cov_0.479655:13239-14852(+)
MESNPFDDDQQIEDPFIDDSSDTTDYQSSVPKLLNFPMPRLLDPIAHTIKSSFKTTEQIYDSVCSGNYLVACHLSKLSVYDLLTSKLVSNLPFPFEGSSTLCFCPEFEDPSLFVLVGFSTGELWIVDILGNSLESERKRVSNYSNVELLGCVVLQKRSITRSPFKKLYQKGTFVIAIDAYGTIFYWDKADVGLLDRDPNIVKIPLTPSTLSLDSSGYNLYFTNETSHCYYLNLQVGTASLLTFGVDSNLNNSTECLNSKGRAISLCLGEFDGNQAIFVGHDDGFISVFDQSFKLIKVVHFSNYSITTLKFRPSCCYISQDLDFRPVLVVCLKTGDYFQVIVDHEFSMITYGYPHKSEDLKVNNSILLFQQIDINPQADISTKLCVDFVILSLKENTFQIDVTSSDLSSWTKRTVLKEQKSNISGNRKIKIRIVSWNMDSSKPTELDRPSVRNKKKRNRLSSLSPFRKQKLDSSSIESLSTSPVGSTDLFPSHIFDDDPIVALLKSKSFDSPDIFVVGFQEVVDLESKRVHASNPFLT